MLVSLASGDLRSKEAPNKARLRLARASLDIAPQDKFTAYGMNLAKYGEIGFQPVIFAEKSSWGAPQSPDCVDGQGSIPSVHMLQSTEFRPRRYLPGW